MPGFAPAPTGWKDRLLAELRRDKKKTALMGVLLLVGAILGVRAVVKTTGDVPAQAQAEVSSVPPAIPGVTAAPRAPVPAFAAPRAGAAGTRAMRSLQARGKVTEDIFTMKVDCYPQDHESNVALAVVVPTSQAIDANLVRAATVLAKARNLSLQSTMISRTPKAIINGQLVGVKDTIQGFEVVEVTARFCVLVQDGVRVQLEMKDQ